MKLVQLVLLVSSLGVLSACGATKKCGPETCSGCCDASGACQSGASNNACGNAGLLCNTCFPGQLCSVGVCSAVGSGGGGGTSTGGGGGSTGGGGGMTGGGGGSTGGGGGTTGGGGGTTGGGGGATGGGGGSTGGGGGATGGGTGTGGGSGTGWDAFCPNYVSALCNAMARCNLYVSASACVQGLSMYVCTSTQTAGLRDGRTRYDSGAAASCLDAFNNNACSAIDFTQCEGVLAGTGTTNSPCYSNNVECGTNLYCDLSSTCPGVCRASAPVGAQPAAGQSCVRGAVHYGSTCIALVPIGQSCAPMGGITNTRECVAGAWCNSSYVCAAKVQAGQACTGAGQCAGLLQCHGGACGGLGVLNAPCDSTRTCKNDLRCANTNVCVARGDQGASCSGFDSCLSHLWCDTTAMTCQPYRMLGEACTYNGYECGFAPGLYCTATSSAPTGVCARAKQPGASCQSYNECSSYACNNGVCAGCVDPTP